MWRPPHHYGKCNRCHLVKDLGWRYRTCPDCRDTDRRAAYRERLRLSTAFIHDGGERDCRCDICYLRRQPVISFQVGRLARAMLY